jgi:hypothetical protein
MCSVVSNTTEALPTKPPPPEPTTIGDDHVSGGVSLDEPQPHDATSSKQLPPAPSSETPPVSAPPGPNLDRRFVLIEGAVSAYNLGTMQTPMRQSKVSISLPATDLNRGDLTAVHHQFTPIQALAKYPYKFCDKNHAQDIASAFFDEGKFWKREWDL